MVLMTCHKVLFGASWLPWLLIQEATPSMTACNEPEGFVDQSISGAKWKKSTCGRRKLYLTWFSVSPWSLRVSTALYFGKVCTLCKRMCSYHYLGSSFFWKQLHSDSFTQFSPCRDWDGWHHRSFVVTLQTSDTAASLLTVRKTESGDKHVKFEMIRVRGSGDLHRSGRRRWITSQRSASQIHKNPGGSLWKRSNCMTLDMTFCLGAAKFKCCCSKYTISDSDLQWDFFLCDRDAF